MGDTASPTMPPPRFLDEKEVAELTGLKPKTLRNWRSSRLAGPAFVKLGPKRVRYPREAVEAWLRSQTVSPDGGSK